MSASPSASALFKLCWITTQQWIISILLVLDHKPRKINNKKKNLYFRSGLGEEITSASDSYTFALSTFKLPILLIFNYGSNGSGCSFVLTLGRFCPVISSEEQGEKSCFAGADVDRWSCGWNSLLSRNGFHRSLFKITNSLFMGMGILGSAAGGNTWLCGTKKS